MSRAGIILNSILAAACVALAVALGVLWSLAAKAERQLPVERKALADKSRALNAHVERLRSIPRMDAAPPGKSGLTPARVQQTMKKHGLGQKITQISEDERDLGAGLREITVHVNFSNIQTPILYNALSDVERSNPHVKAKMVHVWDTRRTESWWDAKVTLAAYERKDAPTQKIGGAEE